LNSSQRHLDGSLQALSFDRRPRQCRV